jgi:hypothetical protein
VLVDEVLGGLAHLLEREDRGHLSNTAGAPVGYAPSGFCITHGARDMLSTPPATTTSASPSRICREACRIASRPEAHSRFTVTAGTDCGSPDSSVAMRATLRLSSPA